ncbi:MAG TPA: Smr/MutS family protein [Thermoanaerobaculia bacterium]|jgi:DNA mismatch repair protein MutS2|nr:Smr/MutS family protein [Thermoanaerobaculia bacterium]
MSSSLDTLEFDRVLTLVAMEAKSAPGKYAVSRRRPLRTLEECERAQADLGEMVRFFHTDGLLPLAGLADVSPLFSRETVLELDESWLIVRAVRATQAMRETLARTDSYPRLRTTASAIPELDELLTKTNKYFTRDGKLREEASAELRAIRTRVQQKRTAIQRTLNDVMNRNADAIQEPLVVMRGDRYCIPVRSDNRNAVPGILHERSGSGASFFIEPMAAIELNNDLADLLIQEREEIARITRFISQTLFDEADAIRDAIKIAGELDALQACAVFHDTIRGSRPTFSANRELHIIDGRHPLLDERLATARQEAFGEDEGQRTVVPISISLGGRRAAESSSRQGKNPLDDSTARRLEDSPPALVISGPNAGGKTVALKTAGLLVAMGMSGLPVPAADGTVLPCVDALHVLIGDDQSVLEHLSTFSAYLTRLKLILSRVTKQSLVLLDELGSGTDPEEGAALAASIIEHLLEVGALVVVTTHLSALKSFAVNDTRIVNASMEFDSATGHPTYRMISGIPGRSRAIEVAKMIGLPASIINSARERLGERYGETDHLLATLQKKMAEIVAQQDELASLRASLEHDRKTLQEKAAALEKERARLGTSYREELEHLRDDVTRQLAAEIKSLRDMDRAARASVNATEVIRTVTKTVDKAVEFIPSEQRSIRVGEKVEHRKFKVVGELVSVDGQKAVLNVNGRKMTVETRDLLPKGAPASPTKGRAEPRPATSDLAAVVAAELNLIGQRVDDALDESDKFLDRALLEGKQAVRIIHGFGTGTLRKAIREHLRKHPAVRSFRAGADNEGGDGATVVEL